MVWAKKMIVIVVTADCADDVLEINAQCFRMSIICTKQQQHKNVVDLISANSCPLNPIVYHRYAPARKNSRTFSDLVYLLLLLLLVLVERPRRFAVANFIVPFININVCQCHQNMPVGGQAKTLDPASILRSRYLCNFYICARVSEAHYFRLSRLVSWPRAMIILHAVIRFCSFSAQGNRTVFLVFALQQIWRNHQRAVERFLMRSKNPEGFAHSVGIKTIIVK